jgi:hypothetical protein
LQPLRIRIDQIADFGLVVSLVGVDIQTGMPVTIHVDHRPFAEVYRKLQQSGLPDRIEYAADRLMLHLDMRPEVDAGTAELLELNRSDRVKSPLDPQACRGLDR